MDKRFKYKLQHHKRPRGENRQENLIHSDKKKAIVSLISPRASDIKERINKWNFIKFKSFCTVKENQKNGKVTNCMGKYIC